MFSIAPPATTPEGSRRPSLPSIRRSPILLLWALLPLTSFAAATMKGVVVARDRAPLAGARVSLVSSGGSEEDSASGRLLAVTDERGVFRFAVVPPGEYRLVCEREGFETSPAERLVIDERVHPDIVIVLVRAGGTAETEEEEELLERLRERRDEAASPGSPGPIPGPFPGAAGVPLADRWRIGLPEWDRTPGVQETPYRRRGLLDPYDQNVLKGDLPVAGQNVFLALTAVSDTLVESRRLPTPSGPSSARPDPRQFFGGGRQSAGAENLLLSFEMFRGNAGFRPVDWRVKLTAGLDLNYLAARERGVVNIDVRSGTDRTDEHVGPQEAFGELKLADIGPRYDFVSLRGGVQGFLSDFRGFVFLDNQPGARLFGSLAANRIQWNLALFDLLEKDTNSGLNSTRSRHQTVSVANVFWQDFLAAGYTLEASFHSSCDRAGSRDPDGGFHYDENGFLVRPAAAGDFRPHNLDVRYYGLAGEGHLGRLNLTHAFYLVRGRDEHNPIALGRVRVRARMAAAEASFDRDWLRVRGSVFYASGDGDPTDGVAKGFDSILDDPSFAGGVSSFWNRQSLRLTGTNLALKGRFSLLPDLRSSKEEGQANFVNPGLFLVSAGVDAELTPRLKVGGSLASLRFDSTDVLEVLLFQEGIRKSLGWDLGLSASYRPALNENVVLSTGLGLFRPSSGFRDIFQGELLASAFLAATLVY